MAPETTQDIPQDLVVQATDLAQWVGRTQIKGETSYRKCCESLAVFQGLRREIKKHFTEVKRPITRAKNEILKMEKAALAEVEPSETRLQQMILGWEEKQHAAREVAAREALEQGTPLVLPPASRPAGQHTRVGTPAVVSDPVAFVRAIREGIVPTDVLAAPKVLEAMTVQMNRLLSAQGDLFDLPGVTVESTKIPIAR